MERIALFVPLVLQALLMVVDETLFHRTRRLPRWERIGHPLDTLTVIACYACVLFVPCGRQATGVYIGLAAFSTLFVTKDELVHASHCSGAEHWLHALLFVLHPVVFLVLALAWPDLHVPSHAADSLVLVVRGQFVAMLVFVVYQTIYWNVPWIRPLPPDAA
jgi:hypothetical protein